MVLLLVSVQKLDRPAEVSPQVKFCQELGKEELLGQFQEGVVIIAEAVRAVLQIGKFEP